MKLKLKNVNKSYVSKKVVNNISFEMSKPGIFGLLGNNGAGKTTTIRMICGLSCSGLWFFRVLQCICMLAW